MQPHGADDEFSRVYSVDPMVADAPESGGSSSGSITLTPDPARFTLTTFAPIVTIAPASSTHLAAPSLRGCAPPSQSSLTCRARHNVFMLSSMRARLILAGTSAVAVGLLLTIATQPSRVPSTTPVAEPSPTTAVRVPPQAVQAFADRVVPSFDGVVRIDRKVVVQLGDVARHDTPGIPAATDATWAIAVVGDIAQTSGRLPTPNSQCAVWFVNSVGQVSAFQSGALSSCDPYISAR